MVYDDCKITKYFSIPEGRWCVLIHFPDGRSKKSYYSRYLMECYLDRALESWEEVHHKDENTLNDELSNLEVLTKENHFRLHHSGNPEKRIYFQGIEYICKECDTPFYPTPEEQLRRTANKKRKGATPFDFCSRSCSARFNKRNN